MSAPVRVTFHISRLQLRPLRHGECFAQFPGAGYLSAITPPTEMPSMEKGLKVRTSHALVFILEGSIPFCFVAGQTEDTFIRRVNCG